LFYHGNRPFSEVLICSKARHKLFYRASLVLRSPPFLEALSEVPGFRFIPSAQYPFVPLDAVVSRFYHIDIRQALKSERPFVPSDRFFFDRDWHGRVMSDRQSGTNPSSPDNGNSLPVLEHELPLVLSRLGDPRGRQAHFLKSLPSLSGSLLPGDPLSAFRALSFRSFPPLLPLFFSFAERAWLSGVPLGVCPNSSVQRKPSLGQRAPFFDATCPLDHPRLCDQSLLPLFPITLAPFLIPPLLGESPVRPAFHSIHSCSVFPSPGR